MKETVDEIWLPVVGFEGLYEASSFSRIKTLVKIVKGKNNCNRVVKEQIIKQCKNQNGYLSVRLSNNKVSRNLQCHRIIAQCFIPNPENKPCVNHINGIRDDNRLENLEWCTKSENAIHSYRILGNKGFWTGKKGKDFHESKPIIQLDLKDVFIREWECAATAARELNINANSIRACCRGERKTAYKSKWKLIKE